MSVPDLILQNFDQSTLSHYIAMARSKRPTVPREVSNYVVDSYVTLRKQSKEEEQKEKSHTYTSARTLLGVLRLAQALARLRFADMVDRSDVDEALRLMEVSKESLMDEDDEGDHDPDRTAISKIFRIIKDMARKAPRQKGPRRSRRRMGKGPSGERDMDVDDDDDDDDSDNEGLTDLSMVEIRSRVLSASFTEDQLMETIVRVSRLICHVATTLTAFNNSTRRLTSGCE